MIHKNVFVNATLKLNRGTDFANSVLLIFVFSVFTIVEIIEDVRKQIRELVEIK